LETKLYIILGLLLVTSGCLNGGRDDQGELPNKGLVIDEFSVSDNELRTGQQANIQATLSNYHRNLENLEINIGNTNTLDVSDGDCNPDPSDLRDASGSFAPKITCTWTVEAPGEDVMEGFPEKKESLLMRITYDATLSNRNSFNVEFKEGSEIESTQTVSKSFSNGEVSADVIVDQPVNADTGTPLEMNIRGTGNGRVKGNYEIGYEPSSVFKNECPEIGRPISGSKWEGVCNLQGSAGNTRSLFFTIHYKYTKAPNLDITIVNRQ
jgi:hypothetical protein